MEINEVEKGSLLIAKVGVVFESILNTVDQVAEQIQEVSTASEHISSSTQEVSSSKDDTSCVQISRKATSYTQDVYIILADAGCFNDGSGVLVDNLEPHFGRVTLFVNPIQT